MTWPQLVVHMREYAGWAGTEHAELALRVVCERIGHHIYPTDELEAAFDAGVLPVIVAAMRAHPASVGMQEAACRALTNGIRFGLSSTFSDHEAVVADVVPLVVMAMRAHLASAGVQEQACTALGMFTIGLDNARLDALPLVVAAMRAHLASAGAQEQACMALFSLIRCAEGAHGNAHLQAAVAAGASPQIVAAMRAHSASAAVQRETWQALHRITCDEAADAGAQGSARRQATVDLGALPAIVAAMRAHPGEEKLKKLAGKSPSGSRSCGSRACA
ncbi:hypothetical protein T492DRAFT_840274 [Pavlovales sp. CCMP2436]|nr:hypothetical protein T492DRAFT_840274 [Pavlovales sp. CCMP2436]